MRTEVQKLPVLFLERLRRIIPFQKWDGVANTFTEPPPPTFRINTLKVGPQFIKEKLEHLGFRIEKVHWYPDAFILREGRLRELQETEIYQRGEIYVQGLSSMVPPLVLDPQPGEKVLDLTAAPGSKTTQMACLMKGEGEITANDSNKVRFFKLRANLEMQGASQVKLSMRYGEVFGREFPETFDRILLDAPCSAEGRFQVQEPASYRYWKPAKVKEMARRQKNLLLSALRALKSGGVLVYSTCTFAPEENEAVLDWALGKLGDQIYIEEVRAQHAAPLSLILNQMPGLTQWEGKSFHPSLRSAIRILPTREMEGFFISRMRRGKA